MSHGKVLLVLFAIAIAVLAFLKQERAGLMEKVQTDDVAFVSSDDALMRAAFKKAQSTLEEFLALAASPPPNTDSFAVKVAVHQGSATEYFWITPFASSEGSFSGRVDNTPRVVSTVREGEDIRFERSDVVDWTYENVAEKKTYGNFTACALLARESKENAAEFKAQYGLDCDN